MLVWPESALPYPLTQDAGTLAAIAELLPEGTALVTGAYREELPPTGDRRNSTIPSTSSATTARSFRPTTSSTSCRSANTCPAARCWKRWACRQLADRSFSPGPHRRPLSLPDGPSFVPLICYEAIFPGDVLGEGPRPDFLLNVTNDGWFGRTTGPYQHFHQARVRSRRRRPAAGARRQYRDFGRN